MLVDKEKQLKVDNWGSFFLHRLFLLYEKGEKCDGTLLFKNGKSIKVHKLVLMTCTDYFCAPLWVNDTFTLSPMLTHEAVLPIINFMYTGFLNFNSEIHHSVFTAAKFLNITILMKLLHAQFDNESTPALSPQPTTDASSAPSITTTITTTTTTTIESSPSLSPSSSSSSCTSASSSASVAAPSLVTSTPLITPAVKSVLRKVKKMPKTAKPIFLTQSSSSAAASSSSTSFSVITASAAQTVPGKKLPFWKKRASATKTAAAFYPADLYLSGGSGGDSTVTAPQPPSPPSEPPTPTRFERLAVDEEDEAKEVVVDVEMKPGAECPSFISVNYSAPPIVTPRKDDHRKRPIHQLTKEINKLNSKRPHLDIVCDKDGIVSSKANTTDVEIIDDPDDPNDVDDDDDDGHFDPDRTSTELIEMDETTISVVPKPSDRSVNGSCSSSEDKFDRLAKCSPPKPILKPLTSECVSAGGGGGGGSLKKVRFSLAAEGKENTESSNSVDAGLGGVATPKVVTPTATAPLKGGGTSSSKEVVTSRVSITGDKTASVNAKQIISELMKKNPDLMKNNKNIRVSIVSGGAKVDKNVPAKSATTKVRYIVYQQASESTGKVGAKMTSLGSGGSTQPVSGAENMTGPWMCEECGVGGKPMDFETYYLYRRHLHDVHQERIDARICEYCGYKSSKRNLHLYHLYTKHNVAPPRNIRFPKCDKCNYIALSDTLLIKHKNNHVSSTGVVTCKPCNLTFKSHAALQCHAQSCPSVTSDLPASLTTPQKEYGCQYCNKMFNRSINLKAHMRIAHKNEESRRMYDEEEEEEAAVAAATTISPHTSGDEAVAASTNNLLQVIRLPMVDGSGGVGGGEQRALLLPAGMFLTSAGGAATTDASGALVPSSEQEAMSTVASGIAASLNLADGSTLMTDQTVILLDGSSELVFEPGNAVMLQSTSASSSQDGGGSSSGTTEYIVPEIITTADADHVNRLLQAHAAAGASLATEADGESDDHSYADETEQQQQQQMVGEEGGHVLEHRTMPGEGVLHDGPSLIVVPSDEQMTQDAVQSTVDGSAVGITASDQLTAPVKPESLSVEVPTSSGATNIVEEACKRDTIIIETSSVAHAQTSGSESVIVTAHARAPRLDLAKDWDDFDSSGDNRASSGDQSDSSQSERVDDRRPSRPTIDLEETILPDL